MVRNKELVVFMRNSVSLNKRREQITTALIERFGECKISFMITPTGKSYINAGGFHSAVDKDISEEATKLLNDILAGKY